MPCTPHQTPPGLAAHDSRPAVPIDHVHTRAARVTDLSDRALRVMKRRGRHGQRRCCNSQNKAKSDQPDHGFLQSCELSRRDFHNSGTVGPVPPRVECSHRQPPPKCPVAMRDLHLLFRLHPALPGIDLDQIGGGPLQQTRLDKHEPSVETWGSPYLGRIGNVRQKVGTFRQTPGPVW